MGDETYATEVRKVETEVLETGLSGGTRTDVTYDLGAVIDGAFVRFGSVPEAIVEAAKARAAEAEQASAASAEAEPAAPAEPASSEPASSEPAPAEPAQPAAES